MRQTLSYFHPRSLKLLNRHLQNLVKGRLWLKILIGMALGITVGLFLSPSAGFVREEVGTTIANWLALPGQIFLGMIQMIVIPLIFASIITGVASSDDMEHLKKIGGRAASYFVFTTIIAITIGIGVTSLIQPGNFIDGSLLDAHKETAIVEQAESGTDEIPSIGQVPQLIANILPDNPLGAMVEKQMLQVVLFAIVLGLALIAMAPKQAKPILDLLNSIQEVCMTVVKWAMLLAPVAVFGLLAQTTINTGIDALLGMAVYVGTVLFALLILMSIYLLFVLIVSGIRPLKFLGIVREVQLLAFSTSSSAAVMPLSITTAEDKLSVKPSTAQFLIPLGATINMDGTALYQGAATVFLAQVFSVDLSMASLLLIVVTTVAASIGAPATPGVGIVILAMVLNSVGIPASGIALILGVDRILDMSRTAVNVTGDLTACLVMERWLGDR
ncbi:MAG: Na+:H+ dicarboxylate symporter [Desulfitibacter sp. BRH_c19]|nr:MAG: Na+:H+ dicarboxylate symporter [Desulfitibacter sp. BRH_c19]